MTFQPPVVVGPSGIIPAVSHSSSANNIIPLSATRVIGRIQFRTLKISKSSMSTLPCRLMQACNYITARSVAHWGAAEVKHGLQNWRPAQRSNCEPRQEFMRMMQSIGLMPRVTCVVRAVSLRELSSSDTAGIASAISQRVWYVIKTVWFVELDRLLNR